MVYNTENKNIYIHNYNQELFMTTMLELWLFIIRSLTMVSLKLIPDIQCDIFIRNKSLL